MSAAVDSHQPAASAAPPLYPRYMDELLDRAASMLQARGLGTVVEFIWWADGKSVPYTARLDWPVFSLDNTARVVVFDGRSGEFTCRSMPGDWRAIDPTTWSVDVPNDEIDRYIWEQAQLKHRRASR